MKSIPYKAKTSKEMTRDELCRYFSFMNAVKFVGLHCRKHKIPPDSVELDSRNMLKYMKEVQGDIKMCLTTKGGIPLKYSLHAHTEESRSIEEIDYSF